MKVPCAPSQLGKERIRATLRRGYQISQGTNLVHVNHFDPDSLVRALEAAGFEQATVRTAAPELSMVVGSRLRVALDDLMRVTIFLCGRWIPGALHWPVTLNLQAYGRERG